METRLNRPQNFRKSRSSPRAMVLILVLWVLVVLEILALGMAQNAKLDSAIRLTAGERVTARWLARAGVFAAIGQLALDDRSVDEAGDTWYDNERFFKDSPLPQGIFTVRRSRNDGGEGYLYGPADEAAKLNINTASVDAIAKLPGMTEAIAIQIVDLRLSADEELAETDGPFPQKRHNRRIETVRSLGRIEAITEELLYGRGESKGLISYVTVYSYELNRDANNQKRINLNTASKESLLKELEINSQQVEWIIQNRSPAYTSIAQLLDDTAPLAPPVRPAESQRAVVSAKESKTDRPKILPVRPDVATFFRIADRITVTDSDTIAGRININTASAVILQALEGVDAAMAERIIAGRMRLPSGFSSIAELLNVKGLTIPHFKDIAPLVTVRSNVFTIRSFGLAARTGLEHHIEAVVDRGPVEPVVIYWKESR